MATRLKTVEYAWPTFTGDLADSTLTSLGTKTLYVPESGVTFKSVYVELGFQDIITATGGTIAEHRVQVQLGAATPKLITNNVAIANTAENIAGVFLPFAVTDHFVANWVGTSMTCEVWAYFRQSTGTTLGMRNVTAKLIVTYEYDDTSANQLKTVRIPLETTNGPLPTTMLIVDTIPQLIGVGGLMEGEAGVAVRDFWVEIEGNEATTVTTDFMLSVGIDGTPQVDFGVQEAALASDRFCRWIASYADALPAINTPRPFRAKSTVASRLFMVTFTVHVTYQFIPASSTATLNSILIPFEIQSPIGGTVAADASRFTRDVLIEEPGPISMVASAARVNLIELATISGLNVRVGAQSFRAYSHVAGVVCGMSSLQHRIDAGATQGAALTLTRGRNTVNLDMYRTDTVDFGTNVNGVIILNYRSAIAAEGVGAHAHTVLFAIEDFNPTATVLHTTAAFAPTLPEPDWYAVAVGYLVDCWIATAGTAFTLSTELQVGEGKEEGWVDLYADAYRADAELGCSLTWVRARDAFQRWVGDPDTNRMQLETARKYRWFTPTASRQGYVMLVTYHAITFEVVGAVSGFAGDGSGIAVELMRAADDTKVLEATTVAGGTFTATWYDDTEELYVLAAQGARAGRSGNGVAT